MPAELPPAAHFDDLLALGRVGLLAAVYSDRGRTLEVEQPLLLEEQSFGSIRVGVSTILIGGELDAALGEALVTMVVALVVSVIVAMLLAQWLLSPIHVIRSGLTRLGRGEFGATLDLKQRDELGELGEYFNDISAQLSADRDGAGAQNREQVLRVLDYSRKLTALSRLSAGLAHEVKNPLNAMTIHLELLRQKLAAAGDADSPVDVSEALRHAAVIGDEIARLDHVLQGFLKFSRPEEIQPEAVAVKSLMDEVAGLVEAEARQAGVRVVVEGAPDVPRISADSDMIRQALLNLARNACQAMPEGGVLRLACAAASGDRVEITVTDTGVGIEPEDLDRIFNLYFTTRAEGSGIGLSLVYRIVQMHDGEVEVESAPGHGTTFRVWLPTAVADEA
jgi:signal transduction histidine kinase